jgi:indole-3-glycerol phosphate synthase
VATYLDRLLDGARRRVADAAAREPLDALRERASDLAPPPSFRDGLAVPGVQVIAEVKRASPSKGPIAPDLVAPDQARAYVDGGAAAVSVLTEPDEFLGVLADLTDVAALGIPALRKDFLVDPYQVWEARVAGASAVLLIAAALDRATAVTLVEHAAAAGVDVLMEVHGPDDLATVADLEVGVFGVNTRDLRTFELDRDGFARLRAALPSGALAVSESGIRDADDVRRAAAEGADAVLVGETLVRAADPVAAVADLVAAGAVATAPTEVTSPAPTTSS